MPTTRRSAAGRSASAAGKQSTLSFPHRVTKSVTKSAKDIAIDSAPAVKKSPLSKSVKPTSEDEEETTTAVEPVETATVEAEVEKDDAQPPPPAKSESELRAEKISNAAVEKYWKGVEAQRIAKRVHQEGLSTGEKVLRYFDVSSQYGPCIGITRMKRWNRAERLGLNPPVEVLAVLLKEEAKGNSGIEQAQMDAIMISTAAGGD